MFRVSTISASLISVGKKVDVALFSSFSPSCGRNLATTASARSRIVFTGGPSTHCRAAAAGGRSFVARAASFLLFVYFSRPGIKALRKIIKICMMYKQAVVGGQDTCVRSRYFRKYLLFLLREKTRLRAAADSCVFRSRCARGLFAQVRPRSHGTFLAREVRPASLSPSHLRRRKHATIFTSFLCRPPLRLKHWQTL